MMEYICFILGKWETMKWDEARTEGSGIRDQALTPDPRPLIPGGGVRQRFTVSTRLRTA